MIRILSAALALICATAAQAQVGQQVGFGLIAIPPAVTATVFDTTRNAGSNFTLSGKTATLLNAAPTGNNFSAFTNTFHSDVKRFARFIMGTTSTSCTQGIGLAALTEVNNAYLGHDGTPGSLSLGVFKDGTTAINGVALTGTGISYAAGDVIDLIFDPVAKTVQEVKNSGPPSVTVSTSTLSTQNVSPAVSPCAANDVVTFDGNPPGVTYSGAIAWDATVQAPKFTSVAMSNQSFTTGTAGIVGTASATVNTGPNSPTWSIKTTGTDSLGATCNNYGADFTIASTTGVVSYIAAAPTQSYPGFCVTATQSGLSNSPYTQASTLVGQAPGVFSAFNTGRNPSNSFVFTNNNLTAARPAVNGTTYTAFTTQSHSTGTWVWREHINQCPGCAVGMASTTETDVGYVGQDTTSFAFFSGGTAGYANNFTTGNLTYGTGNDVDIIVNFDAKTAQMVVNGGTPGPTINLSNMTTLNLSPAFTAGGGATGDSATFNGTLAGIGFNGASSWDDPSPTTAKFTSIKMSGRTFVAGGTAPVGTATATANNGMPTPTWTIKTSGPDSLGTTCHDYSSYLSINSSTGVVTPTSGAPAQSYPGFCPQAAQTGLATYSQAQTLTGNASTPLVVTLIPSSATEICNVSAGTQVAQITTSGGDGNPINSVSITTGGPDFAVSSGSSLPSNVIIGTGGLTNSGYTCPTLPSGGATENVGVLVSQP
jgi:hypothetical protein